MLWGSLVVDQTREILSISILHERMRQLPQLRSSNKSHSVSNFFRTGNLQALTLLDRLDKRSSVNERFKCSRIEPCETPPHARNFSRPSTEVSHIEVRDFEFTAVRWPDLARITYNVIIVKIEPCYRPVRHGLFGFSTMPLARPCSS